VALGSRMWHCGELSSIMLVLLLYLLNILYELSLLCLFNWSCCFDGLT
jgi:hypothetical protein